MIQGAEPFGVRTVEGEAVSAAVSERAYREDVPKLRSHIADTTLARRARRAYPKECRRGRLAFSAGADVAGNGEIVLVSHRVTRFQSGSRPFLHDVNFAAK